MLRAVFSRVGEVGSLEIRPRSEMNLQALDLHREFRKYRNLGVEEHKG